MALEADARMPEAPAPPAAVQQASAQTASGQLWAEASDLLDGLDDASTGPGSRRGFDPVELTVTLTADEHARLRDRADAQGVSLQEALRRLI